MTPEQQDELWRLLGALERLSKDDELKQLVPGLQAVAEVLTDQVGSALNEIKQAQSRTDRSKRMAVTRLGPDGTPKSSPRTVVYSSWAMPAVEESPRESAMWAQIQEMQKRKRGR